MNTGLKSCVGTVLFMLLALNLPKVNADELKRITYGQKGLVVDLGVGLWAWPVPVDWDGDGDMDLLVSCPDKPYNGTYFFENPGTPNPGTPNKNSTQKTHNKLPVFKAGVRLGNAIKNVQLSIVDGKPRVLSMNYEHVGFAKKDVAARKKIYNTAKVHTHKVRANQWRYVDYDGDGRLDLIVGVGDWKGYGWDDAFDKNGKWTKEDLHGWIYLIRNKGTNDKPVYEDKTLIQADGKPVDVFGMPSPNFGDFDGDGDLDLLCGEFLDGFTYFQNTGTRKKPVYAKGVKLANGAKPVAMDLQMITPNAVDWDGDGDLDLICGDEDGRVAFIEHTGQYSKGMPVFKQPVYFQQEAQDVKFGALSTPWGSDWDGDGDEDILCGNTAGYIGYFENLGGEVPPKFAKVKYLKADGEVIRILAGYNGSIQGPCEAKWGYTTLSVGDWNGDGLPDVMANSIWGKVIWYENVGTRKEPRLTKAKGVEVQWKGKAPKPAWNWWDPKGNELATQWRTTPVMVDMNKDGLIDLVMLDHEGCLAFYERAKVGDQLILKQPTRVFYDDKGKLMRLNPGHAGRSGRRKICITDWDGDGKLDILINTQNASLLRNVSKESGKWMFKDEGLLDTRKLAGHTTSPAVVDWNKDGRPDLLLGGEDGYLYYKENKQK